MLVLGVGYLLAQILDFGFELGVFTAEVVNGELEFGILTAQGDDFIIYLGKVIQKLLVVTSEHLY